MGANFSQDLLDSSCKGNSNNNSTECSLAIVHYKSNQSSFDETRN